MGWNSWDAYGLTITEQQFRENVDVLAKTPPDTPGDRVPLMLQTLLAERFKLDKNTIRRLKWCWKRL